MNAAEIFLAVFGGCFLGSIAVFAIYGGVASHENIKSIQKLSHYIDVLDMKVLKLQIKLVDMENVSRSRPVDHSPNESAPEATTDDLQAGAEKPLSEELHTNA